MPTRRTVLKSTAALALGTAASALPTVAFARAAFVATQAPGFYRLKLGNFEITALSDGTAPMPMAQIYEGISEEDAQTYLASRFQSSPAELSVNAYLVNTGDRLVLIDAGTGQLLGPNLGKLVANIQASGYGAEQVDDVILTHIHADHSGGLTHEGRRVYENAVLHVNAREAQFWLQASAEARADAALGPQIAQAHSSINPYDRAGKLQIFADDAEPLPGFGSVLRPGHTPGHSAITIQSGGQTLVFWGDVAHGDVLQFDRPGITVEADIDQSAAAATRAIAFAEAADQGYLVAGAHHAFPGIGHVRRDETNYDWVPVVYRASY